MRRFFPVLLFFPLLLVCIFVFTSFPSDLADQLIKNDHIKRADIVYKANRLFQPHNKNLDQRLIITRALIGYPHPSNLKPYPSPRPEITASQIPILEYHYIRRPPNSKNPSGTTFSVEPKEFAKHMDYLATHQFTTLTLAQFDDILLHQATPPARPVLITFDDGYADLYHIVLPILKSKNLHATAFIVTKFIDGPEYLTTKQLLELDRSGRFDFGSHTLTHPSLPLLSSAEISQELAQSKSALENLFGHSVDWLCYPYGLATPQIEDLAKEFKYLGAFISTPDSNQSPADRYHLPRTIVSGKYNLEEFVNLTKLK